MVPKVKPAWCTNSYHEFSINFQFSTGFIFEYTEKLANASFGYLEEKNEF